MSKRNKPSNRRLAREAKTSSSNETAAALLLPPAGGGACSDITAPVPVGRGWMRPGLIAVLVAIVTAGVGLYQQTLHYDLVLDDQTYVMNNPFLASASSFLYPLDFARFATSAARRGS